MIESEEVKVLYWMSNEGDRWSRRADVSGDALSRLEKEGLIEYPAELVSPTPNFPRGVPYLTDRGRCVVYRAFYPLFLTEREYTQHSDIVRAMELVRSPIIGELRGWLRSISPEYADELRKQLESLKWFTKVAKTEMMSPRLFEVGKALAREEDLYEQ